MRVVLAIAACLAAGLICVRAQEEPEDAPAFAFSDAFAFANLENLAGSNALEHFEEFLSQAAKSPKAQKKDIVLKDKTRPNPGAPSGAYPPAKTGNDGNGTAGSNKPSSKIFEAPSGAYPPAKPGNDGNGTAESNKPSSTIFEAPLGGHPPAKPGNDEDGTAGSNKPSPKLFEQLIAGLSNGTGKLPNFGNHTGMSNGTFNIGLNNFGEILAKFSNISKMANNGNCTGGNHLTSMGFPKFDPKAIIFFMLNATCGELFKSKWETIKRHRTLGKDADTTEHVHISSDRNLIISRSSVVKKTNVVSSVSAYDLSKDDAPVIHAPMNFLMPCLLSDNKRGLSFSEEKDKLVAENNTLVVGYNKEYKAVSSDPLSKEEVDALKGSNPVVRCLCLDRPIHRLVDAEDNSERITGPTVQVAFLTLDLVLTVACPADLLLKRSNLTLNALPDVD
ncbi:hypothetical protein BsWGS_07550 [Bradybaena similaris]